ncbi:hypothetical protein HPB51_018195 [Rhipicephalus microplus]|uniref:Uncharacterized protein n=1 Tax=Rhipicephalus microplus TaxID=6941 RepID=A0A9J6DAP8_RHIMP|nr:hypothetical protein HPB51_018195 [Rhipicephalus microplus]
MQHSQERVSSASQEAMDTTPSVRAQPAPKDRRDSVDRSKKEKSRVTAPGNGPHFASGDGADVRPPDTRLSAWGVESRLPGWISEWDLRDAGCSKGTHRTKQSPFRSCPCSRPSKTARLQRAATAEAMPHRRHSYEDNFVNRQSQDLARLSLTEERDEVVVSATDDEDAKEMNGMDEVTSRKAIVVYADGDGHGSRVGRRVRGDVRQRTQRVPSYRRYHK